MGAENSRFFQEVMSRREMLRKARTAGEAGLGYLILAKMGVFPKLSPEWPNPEKIDPLTLELLQEYKFQTVAHNGGNYGPFYREFAKTGCDFIEVDVFRHHGEVYAGHEEYFRGIGIDTSQRSISLSWPSVSLSSVIRKIKKDGYKAYIDFKDIDSPEPTLKILQENDMLSSSVFSAEAWPALGNVGKIQGGNASNLFYTMQSERNINTFFSHDGFPDGPFGISMDEGIASDANITRFKDAGASVFIYPIKTARQALRVLKNGADGLITNNLMLLSLQITTA